MLNNLLDDDADDSPQSESEVQGSTSKVTRPKKQSDETSKVVKSKSIAPSKVSKSNVTDMIAEPVPTPTYTDYT